MILDIKPGEYFFTKFGRKYNEKGITIQFHHPIHYSKRFDNDFTKPHRIKTIMILDFNDNLDPIVFYRIAVNTSTSKNIEKMLILRDYYYLLINDKWKYINILPNACNFLFDRFKSLDGCWEKFQKDLDRYNKIKRYEVLNRDLKAYRKAKRILERFNSKYLSGYSEKVGGFISEHNLS